MLELGPGADILRGIGFLMWMLIIGTLVGAWALPNTRPGKYLAVATVLGLLIAFPGRWAWERQKSIDHYRARLQQARAIFQERCKNAGEKIYRTVDDIEAIAILRKRRYIDTLPQIAEDPFGAVGNRSESDYPLSFLLPRGKDGQLLGGWMGGYLEERSVWDQPGYAYVDLRDQDDDSVSRYTLAIHISPGDATDSAGDQPQQSPVRTPPYRFVVNKFPSPGPLPRYGVIFEDLTTPEERAQWIAGSAFRVLDLQTNEILAERIGYFMDEGMGATGGSRTPWQEAKQWSCPDYAIGSRYRFDWDRAFTEQVLKIKKD